MGGEDNPMAKSVVKGTAGRSYENLTTKQFGDACEHLVLAELILAADWAGHKMPDGWPGYDLNVSKGAADDHHISVKGRRARVGHSTPSTWTFSTDDGWGWLALVFIDDRRADSERSIYLVPRKWALANGRPQRSGDLRIGINDPRLKRFLSNFGLKNSPA
jgi:hypothetical protein